MDIILVPLLAVVVKIIDLYRWLLIIYVIMGWLEAFGIVNRYNQFIYGLHTFLFRIIEPALVPIRRFMPNMGDIDLSPLALVFGLYLIQGVFIKILQKFPG
ncbi:MAG: YggT family protein [Alphaproteobacteria bacterium]|nr:YggT family protein [Alphaproteobacteria bacterium]